MTTAARLKLNRSEGFLREQWMILLNRMIRQKPYLTLTLWDKCERNLKHSEEKPITANAWPT